MQQKYIAANPLVWVVIVAVAWFVVGDWRAAQAQELTDKVAYVQQVCDSARAEFSGKSEQACGDAQDRAGAEYLCDSYAPSARCWVEVK